jgi:hypothetical protein
MGAESAALKALDDSLTISEEHHHDQICMNDGLVLNDMSSCATSSSSCKLLNNLVVDTSPTQTSSLLLLSFRWFVAVRLLELPLRRLLVNTAKDILLDIADNILCEVVLFKTGQLHLSLKPPIWRHHLTTIDCLEPNLYGQSELLVNSFVVRFVA